MAWKGNATSEGWQPKPSFLPVGKPKYGPNVPGRRKFHPAATDPPPTCEAGRRGVVSVTMQNIVSFGISNDSIADDDMRMNLLLLCVLLASASFQPLFVAECAGEVYIHEFVYIFS